ncbi:MAG: lysophospholipid acyltransferase family protein [Bacteroidota bacterium]
MKNIRGTFRFLQFIILILFFMSRYLLSTVFSGRDLKKGLKERQAFAKAIKKVIGVELEVKGKPSSEAAIYVCNHRSYYDPGAIAIDLRYSVVVAKAEIRNWPLIGYATDFIGIIFVNRDSSDSRKATREAMSKALEDGLSILIYPEGTTGDRSTTLDFLPGTFATAVKMNIPIIPVAIEYKDTRAAWVDPHESFFAHYTKCFNHKRTPVKLRYGQAIFHEDVLTFKQMAQDWIDKNLLEMQAEFGGVAWPATVNERIKLTGR